LSASFEALLKFILVKSDSQFARQSLAISVEPLATHSCIRGNNYAPAGKKHSCIRGNIICGIPKAELLRRSSPKLRGKKITKTKNHSWLSDMLTYKKYFGERRRRVRDYSVFPWWGCFKTNKSLLSCAPLQPTGFFAPSLTNPSLRCGFDALAQKSPV
jgi:hypothetical protein